MALDINMATREDLASVSGIGEKLADAIVRYRERRGKFMDWDDLKKIPGVTDATIKKFQDADIEVEEAEMV